MKACKSPPAPAECPDDDWTPPQPAEFKPDKDHDDYMRRRRAAGMPDRPPLDYDAARLHVARLIYLFINEWHGCRERLCRRQRGCMAPSGVCSNVTIVSEEEDPEGSARALAVLHQALKEYREEHPERYA